MLPGPEQLAAAARERTQPDASRLRRSLDVLTSVPATSLEARLEAMCPALEGITDPRSDVRRWLVRELPAHTGLHPVMVRRALDVPLARLAPAALARHLRDHPRRLRARAATAVVHAGNVPGLAALDVAVAVACGDPVAVKGASAEPLTGIVMAESLRATTGVRCAEAYSWGRADREATDTLLAWADRLLAYGTDATIQALAARWRRAGGDRDELLAFGHRVSAAWVPRRGHPVEELAGRLAVDVAMWDQEGCLSPHVVFVEQSVDAVELGAALGDALTRLASTLPRGTRTFAERAAVRAWLSRFEARAAASPGSATRIWRGDDHVVVLDDTGPAGPSPLGRSIRLCPVPGEAEMLRALEGWPLQALAVGAPVEEHRHLAGALERLGATRLCAAGHMQEPGDAWLGDEMRLDGRRHVAVESDTVGVWKTFFEPEVDSPGR